jgi:hypothetical protein
MDLKGINNEQSIHNHRPPVSGAYYSFLDSGLISPPISTSRADFIGYS